ncbi:hypothetical protein V7x_50470 [Crateriforma conspicua]|uniref:Uncharacterized protein n=1 Tax=Crateriforma conspicua TaxID=2527996 RepID=A0A5C6FMN3_9PLAN|nr:hypothetical protein V7x_50470 [Crateriforma conspicua]
MAPTHPDGSVCSNGNWYARRRGRRDCQDCIARTDKNCVDIGPFSDSNTSDDLAFPNGRIGRFDLHRTIGFGFLIDYRDRDIR